MTEITLYSTRSCVYCRRAEQLLKSKGADQLNTILVDAEPGQREQMIARTGRRTVPQIFIGSLHVGGFDDLYALNQSGRLERLLAT